MRGHGKLFLVLAGLNLLWAPVNYMVQVASAGGLSTGAIALTRWVSFGALLFLALSLRGFREKTRARWPEPADAVRAVLIGILFFAPSHLLYYTTLNREMTSTVEGTVLQTAAPIFTAVLAMVLLREPVPKRRWTAIGIGFVGTYIVSVGTGLPSLSAEHTLGNLLYALGVLLESIVGVTAVNLIRRSSGITILAFQILGAAAGYAMAPMILPDVLPLQVTNLAPSAIAAMAYLIGVAGFFCFGVWYMKVEKAPLSLMVISVLLQPPLSAVIGYFVLGEKLGPNLALGGLLIFVALLLGATDRERRLTARHEMAHHEA